MSYCRFRNTERDLRDCLENLDDEGMALSPSEKQYRTRLIKLCRQIVRKADDDETLEDLPEATVSGD